jgi:hypothetical protein
MPGNRRWARSSPTISVVVAFRPTVWRSILDGLGAIRLSNRRRMSLNTIAIWQSVLAHYRSMWSPLVLPLIESGERLVLEGSALLPELVSQLDMQHVRAIWLVAAEGVLERRIRAESDYGSRDPDARFLIDKFAQRAVAFNRFVGEEASRLSLQKIEVGRETSVNELLQLCLEEPK